MKTKNKQLTIQIDDEGFMWVEPNQFDNAMKFDSPENLRRVEKKLNK